jgi:hypothetical protein
VLLLLPQHCLKAIFDHFGELLVLAEISNFQTFNQKMSSGSTLMTALLLLPQHCLKAILIISFSYQVSSIKYYLAEISNFHTFAQKIMWECSSDCATAAAPTMFKSHF